MSRKSVFAGGCLVAVGVVLFCVLTGCWGTVAENLTKERTGNISVVLVNDTPYRASLSYGTWDAWDRSPGTVTMQQVRVPANSTTSAATVPCRRNCAIGTQDFVDRVIATNADKTDTFDADAFDTVVHFSSAPSDSNAAALPTEGTALGREVLLGVDYSCADEIIFTFVQDPDAVGGFRIDFEVILDDTQD